MRLSFSAPAGGFDRLTRAVKSAARLTAVPLAVLVALTPFAGSATVSAADEPTAAELERYYNPFGDPWASNKGPNPYIPVGLTAPCHRRGPHAERDDLIAEEVAFLAKSSSPIILEECAEITEENPKVRAVGAALKAAAPHLKYIGYTTPTFASTLSLNGEGPHPAGLREIDDQHEEFFLHKKGRPATRENRVKYLRPGTRPRDALDVTNPNFRRFMADKIADALESHNMGGVAVDACHKDPGPFINPNEVDPRILARWEASCVNFLADLKKAVGRDKLVFFLGLSDDGTQLLQPNSFTERRLKASDGFLWEDPIGPAMADLRDRVEGYFWRMNVVFDIAQKVQQQTRSKKYVGVWVNTNANAPNNNGTFRDTNKAKEQQYARYYVAAFLTIMRGDWTPLFYYTPVPGSAQFHSETFFKDWNLRIGNPVMAPDRTPARKHPGGTNRGQEIVAGKEGQGSVWYRKFQNGEVYLNNTKTSQMIRFDRVMYTPEGRPVRSYLMPKETGMVFLNSRELTHVGRR